MSIQAAVIKRGSTDLLELTLVGKAVQDATVYVTLRQSDRQITKTNRNNDESVWMVPLYNDQQEQVGTTIYVQYTQAETLRLRSGFAKVQVRWIDDSGVADVSDMGRVKIPVTLYEGVIDHVRNSN